MKIILLKKLFGDEIQKKSWIIESPQIVKESKKWKFRSKIPGRNFDPKFRPRISVQNFSKKEDFFPCFGRKKEGEIEKLFVFFWNFFPDPKQNIKNVPENGPKVVQGPIFIDFWSLPSSHFDIIFQTFPKRPKNAKVL